MDDLEQRLREDAARIHAYVPSHLRARIDASLRDAKRRPSPGRAFTWPLWLGASLTAAATAVVAIVAINAGGARNPRPQADDLAYSVPEYVRELERDFPLRTKTAALTAPLEEELQNLRADLERAREDLEQELGFTF